MKISLLMVSKSLIIMPTSLFQENVSLSDFHRKNSMAAQREARLMSLHPYSREQKIQQILMMKNSPTSKESSNLQRNKLTESKGGQRK